MRMGWIIVLALFVVTASGLGLQRFQSRVLREELELVREERRSRAQLESIRGGLLARQPTAEEVQRLRSDRAAMTRLRDEVARLQSRVDEREQAVERKLERAAASPEKGMAETFAANLMIDADARWWHDGAPTDVHALRAYLRSLARGSLVKAEVRLPTDGRMPDPAALRREHQALTKLADELGVQLEIRVVGLAEKHPPGSSKQ